MWLCVEYEFVNLVLLGSIEKRLHIPLFIYFYMFKTNRSIISLCIVFFFYFLLVYPYRKTTFLVFEFPPFSLNKHPNYFERSSKHVTNCASHSKSKLKDFDLNCSRYRHGIYKYSHCSFCLALNITITVLFLCLPTLFNILFFQLETNTHLFHCNV